MTTDKDRRVLHIIHGGLLSAHNSIDGVTRQAQIAGMTILREKLSKEADRVLSLLGEVENKPGF